MDAHAVQHDSIGARCLIAVISVLLALAVGSLPMASASAATPSFPTLTGAELKALYYASLPLPGTAPITARPAIYGHAGADQRIQQLAEARGYRLQVTPTVGLGSYGGLTLAPDAGRAWVALLDASRRNGTPLQGNSGYRSIAQQRDIFRRRLGGWSTEAIAAGRADSAIEAVLAYHSIPGYSRHHTGKTIDMSQAGGSNGSFAGSAAYRWLAADNYAVAKSFGFIPNYPPGAGAQGPNPEPWEFVHLGTERIRCAAEVTAVADPRARAICGLADRPIMADLTADGIDDVFVYRAGRSPEGLYVGTRSREVAHAVASVVDGAFTPIVGDFDGSGTDDVLWYGPGTAPDRLWSSRSDGSHTSTGIVVDGTFTPVAGDFDGNGTDDILWHGAGTAPDRLWLHSVGGGRTSTALVVDGAFAPVSGDFDGSGTDDVLWYAPGPAPDRLWSFRADGTFSSTPLVVDGVFTPAAGDFDGNGADDVLWYAPGATADRLWSHSPGGGRASSALSIIGAYEVAAGDHDGDGLDDVVFLAPPGSASSVWFGSTTGFDARARSY